MSKTIAPQAVPAAAQAAVNTAKPAIIATRRRCEADGVGLSHYILMDRKAK
ncbi:MAG TPA: modified peptide precursor CbpA [Aromatoleum sp.]|uniref:modified peptide precursor CbpA n=1 Tax=Aromatoleum sp. TaxID=2307007 RepID=UPI002B473127|nr:modified peptide precursor CbpA [Aromatoleum sp.]HJV24106.1 modified peptide precursor CbpA [Aromatoleum sp.]